MARENYNDLVAFLTVAQAGSFTRAAAQMGVTQSALSHTIRALEERLGIRLLTRTTRSVAPTEAGERLISSLGPRFVAIDKALVDLSELKDKPAGIIRITTAEHAADSVLWPRLCAVMAQYPEIHIELNVNYGLTDIVAHKFDAGVRLGDQVEKDMIAVPISKPLAMAVVGSPDYFSRYSMPLTLEDLPSQSCINLRLPTHDSLLPWEFKQGDHLIKVHVEGQWVFNSGSAILRAVLAGAGLAYLPLDMVQPHMDAGRLMPVLATWWPSFPSYYLYYPSRRQSSLAFRIVLDALRQ